MKYKSRVPLSLAALSIALFLPELTHAQASPNMQSSKDTATQSSQQEQQSFMNQSGKQEAQQMVPARAYLVHKLDAKDMKPGTDFTAKLADNVQLKNGPKLDRGTELLGKVTTDDMNVKGSSKLALRITQARMKDGKTIPVKATIVAVYAPETENVQGQYVGAGDEQPNDWQPSVVKIDQLNAIGGVDLHSRIAGRNSGVFVSTKKDDFKLAAGSELALAIAEKGTGNSHQSYNSGGL